ncbi:MAG TPA: hypothetical protein VGU03_05310 [Frateuria sp.]|uniref:hypothetical protein n=1 Tax=Frateuria sp. TaxID=2211372 RepID=UPI002DEA1B64|nr:hypothetical protein [Frateuria sp.]
MFDIVDFLEEVGQDAMFSRASTEEILASSLAAQLTLQERNMLAEAAAMRRAGLLDAQALYCMQFPAEEEEGEEREPEPDPDEPLRDNE